MDANDEEDESVFTERHDKAMAEAETILKKHFDAYVLIAYAQSDCLKKEQVRCHFDGGKILAYGLLQEAVEII